MQVLSKHFEKFKKYFPSPSTLVFDKFRHFHKISVDKSGLYLHFGHFFLKEKKIKSFCVFVGFIFLYFVFGNNIYKDSFDV